MKSRQFLSMLLCTALLGGCALQFALLSEQSLVFIAEGDGDVTFDGSLELF